jgi:hypothetical protein
MTVGYPCLALAPLAGLTVNCLSHIGCCRLIGGQRRFLCFFVGFAAGGAAVVWLSWAALAPLLLGSADGAALFLFCLATYVTLSYGYYNFVTLNVTSLRIRLLQEMLACPAGLPVAEVWRRYGVHEIVRRRIVRLTQGGHLVEKNGRFYLAKRSILCIARIIDTLRYLILGPTPFPAEARPAVALPRQRRTRAGRRNRAKR